MKQLTYPLLLALFLAAFAGCGISDNEIEPQLRFSQIYDNGIIGQDYFPLDVIQTPDQGYLVLAASNDWDIYLLKADSAGVFDWERPLSEPYVNAVPQLISDGANTYFFCMDEVSLETYLMRVDESGNDPEEFLRYPDIQYPLAASQTDQGQVLLLGYDRVVRNTQLNLLNASFTEVWDEGYPVFTDVEEPIIGHLTRTGDRLPFFTGESTQGFFFNAFRNFSMSLVFVNSATGEQTGVISGFREDESIAAASVLPGGTYGIARYSFGESYLLPSTGLDPNAEAISNELGGFELPELDTGLPVVTEALDYQDQSSTVLFGGTTRSGRMVIYAYEDGGSDLLGTRYLGANQPYELAAMRATADGGLIVLGTTYVAGRYPRICLFKLSAEDVAQIEGR